MSFEQIILEILKIITGKQAGVEPFLTSPQALLLVFTFALLGLTAVLARLGRLGAAAGCFALAAVLAVSFYVVQTGGPAAPGHNAPNKTAEAKPARPPESAPPTVPVPLGGPAGPHVLQPPSPVFDLLEGRTLIGRDLGSAAGLREQKLSLDACRRECGSRAECAAFTFDTSEQSCILKGAVGEQVNFPAAVSGIKRSDTALSRP